MKVRRPRIGFVVCPPPGGAVRRHLGRGLVLALAIVLALGSGCATTRARHHEYLQTQRHPVAVRASATLGEVVGFIVGLPFTVLAFPVSVPYALLSDLEDPYRAAVYPSVALSEVGATVFGAPVDAVLGQEEAPETPAAVETPAPAEPEEEAETPRRRRGGTPRSAPPEGD